MSVNAYNTNQRASETPRQTEYRLFAEITRELIQAKERHEKGERDSFVLNAVNRNVELWNVLMIDLVQPENQLPEALRAQLVSIALWVDRHSIAFRHGKAKLDALIEVNRSIMGGLQ